MRHILIAFLGLVLLAGCGTSPKTQFFTLTPVPPSGPPSEAEVAPVSVIRFVIPRTLDRHELVRRTGANELDVQGSVRWGASLGEIARKVLSRDLRMRLAPGNIVAPRTMPSGAGVRQLVVEADAFAPLPDGTTVLDATWTLLSPDGTDRVMQRHVRLAVAGGASGGADQAAAMSQALGKLADRIAAALTRP